MEVYDVVIIGSGPAGLTAGLYTARAGLQTIILENEKLGGYLVNIDLIENYPGFTEGIRGNELAHGMMKQAMSYGVEFQLTEVVGLELGEDPKVVKTIQGDYSGKAIIIAGGSHPKKLGITGEEDFIGKGVAYCAVCEGIEEIKEDGTLVSTEEGYEITKEILGVDLREVKFADMEDAAKEVVSALRKAAEKYNAYLPVY